MRDTYLSLYYHIVFSTKGRTPYFEEPVAKHLYPYIIGFCKKKEVQFIRGNGMPDHLHLLIGVYRGDFVLSDFVRELKKATNKFISVNRFFPCRFAWQAGYGALTVDRRNLPVMIDYIERQEEHHKQISFEDEWERFMKQPYIFK